MNSIAPTLILVMADGLVAVFKVSKHINGFFIIAVAIELGDA